MYYYQTNRYFVPAAWSCGGWNCCCRGGGYFVPTLATFGPLELTTWVGQWVTLDPWASDTGIATHFLKNQGFPPWNSKKGPHCT